MNDQVDSVENFFFPISSTSFVVHFFFHLNKLLSPIYFILSLIAILSLRLPFLTDLATHGKTRSHHQTHQTHQKIYSNAHDGKICNYKKEIIMNPESNRKDGSNSIRETILHGNLFLIQKQWFRHFYLVGIVCTIALYIILQLEKRFSSELVHNIDFRSKINRENLDHDLSNSQCFNYNWNYGLQAKSTQTRQTEPIQSMKWLIYHNYSVQQQIATLLLLIHLFRRYYECLYVHKWGTKSKMHLAGYFLGIIHYAILPTVFLYPFPSDILLHMNDTDCFEYIVEISNQLHSNKWWNLFCGVILFTWGQFQQYQHHCILANLRQIKDFKPHNNQQNNTLSLLNTNKIKNKTKQMNYQIPQGRLFQYISCPHYFAEIIIYLSFFMLLRYQQHIPTSTITTINPIYQLHTFWNHGISSNSFMMLSIILSDYKHLALFIWVFINLSISAKYNHEWYHQTFGELYPNKRKRIIPFIW